MTAASLSLLAAGRLPASWLRTMARACGWTGDLPRAGRWVEELASADIRLSGDQLFGETLGTVANVERRPRGGRQPGSGGSPARIASTASRRQRARVRVHTEGISPASMQRDLSGQRSDRPSFRPRVDEPSRLPNEVDVQRPSTWARGSSDPSAISLASGATASARLASAAADREARHLSPLPRPSRADVTRLIRNRPTEPDADEPKENHNALGVRQFQRLEELVRLGRVQVAPPGQSAAVPGAATESIATGTGLVGYLVRRVALALGRAGITTRRPGEATFLVSEWSRNLQGLPAQPHMLTRVSGFDQTTFRASEWSRNLPGQPAQPHMLTLASGDASPEVGGSEAAAPVPAAHTLTLTESTRPSSRSSAPPVTAVLFASGESPTTESQSGGPAGHSLPSATEVDEPAGLFSLRRLVARGEAAQSPSATAGAGDPIALPDPSDPDDLDALAVSIKRILDEEARRHGIDV